MVWETPEFRLLLACVKAPTKQEDEAAIRQMLEKGVDWTLFAQTAIDHDLAVLAGHMLLRVAPDLVPDDILDAFSAIIERTRRRNRVLFDELAGVIEVLANDGVEVIPFEGPILTIRAFGDTGSPRV